LLATCLNSSMAREKQSYADDHGETDVAVFRALADPTRRQILKQLQKGELAAGQISSRFPISGPSVSRHLAVLKAAGLVSERRDANRILYSLVPEPLTATVGSFLEAVCPGRVRAPGQGKKKSKASATARARAEARPTTGAGAAARPTTGAAAAARPTTGAAAAAAARPTVKQKRKPQRNGSSGGHSTPRTVVTRPVTQANN